MKALFWLLVFAGLAGVAATFVLISRRMEARKQAEEARAMQVLAEAMRARETGTSGRDSGSPPDQTPP